MSHVDLADVAPGILDAVSLVRIWGFETTDSGDGSHFLGGMEGAMEEPMIAIVCKDPHNLVDNAGDLQRLINRDDVRIEASYDPRDKVAVIVLVGPGLLELEPQTEGE